MAVIIAIFNEKGGVGKTTSCLNLSAYIATRQSKKVLTIDTDPQANLTEGFGITDHNERPNLLDLYNDENLDKLIQPTGLDNLSIIPSTGELKAVELKAELGTEMVLKNFMDRIKDGFDYIFIDSPPSMGKLAVGALVASHWFVIPVQAEFYPLRGIGGALENYTLVQKRLNPSLKFLGSFITMFDVRTNLSKEVEQACHEFFGDDMFRTKIRRNVSLAESPAVGETIFSFDPNSHGAEDYRRLANEVLHRIDRRSV